MNLDFIKKRFEDVEKSRLKKLAVLILILSIFYVYISIQEVVQVLGEPFTIKFSYVLKYFFIWLSVVAPVSYIYIHLHNVKLHKLFLTIVIPVSMFYTFVFTPGSIPDEMTHYKNSFDLASTVTGHKGEITRDENDYTMLQTMNTDNANRIRLAAEIGSQNDDSWVPYEPYEGVTDLFSYFPQVIGVILSRILNISIVFELYLVRLINLACYIALTYKAIKLIPKGKLLLMTTAVLPMSIHQAASASYDALLLGTSFYAVAFGIAYIEGNVEKKINGINCLYVLCAIDIFFIKGKAYTPLLLLFMIPFGYRFIKRKAPNKYKIIVPVIVVLSIIAMYALFVFLASKNLSQTGPFYEWCNSNSYGAGYIFTHPISTMKIIFRSYIPWFVGIGLTGRVLATTTIGSHLSWLSVTLSTFSITAWMAVLGASALADTEGKEAFKIKYKVLAIIISMGVIIAVSLGLMLYWTPFGCLNVAGLQGRYYIPVVVPIMLVFSNNILRIKGDQARILLYLIPIISSFTMIEIVKLVYV